MSTNYRKKGLPKAVDIASANHLKANFYKSTRRRLKTGTFIGYDQIKSILGSLDSNGLDGIQICYGLSDPVPGKSYGTYELVVREVKLAENEKGEIVAVKKGGLYTSVDNISTEPPTLSCPPLRCQETQTDQ